MSEARMNQRFQICSDVAWHGATVNGAGKKNKEVFFFEKKNQKTFSDAVAALSSGTRI